MIKAGVRGWKPEDLSLSAQCLAPSRLSINHLDVFRQNGQERPLKQRPE